MKRKNNFIVLSVLLVSVSVNSFAEINYKRNPFESLVSQKISSYETINSSKKENDESIPLIRRYDLTKYEITGLIQSSSKELVLVVEKYSGKTFYLKKLDFLGNEDEQIIRVERNQVVLGKFEPSLSKYVETNFIVINRKK